MNDRWLPIFDGNDNFVHQPAMALAAYMHFPFDSESANHYYQIMSKEMNRGPDAELSHIGKLISNDVKRRKRRAFLAGRVALEMIEQAIKSGQPSLQKAATIVSDIAYDTTVDGGCPSSEFLVPEAE